MKRKLFFVFVLCLVIVAVVGGSFVHDVFLVSPKLDAKPVEVVIEKGDSVNAIDLHLQKAGLVTHPLFFKWFVEFTHTQTKIQAGSFALVPGTSISSLVFLLTSVKNTEIKITIPEGFTNNQIKEKLSAAFPDFDSASWDTQTKDLQGYLFPDTYQFAKDATVSDIIKKMKSTLDRRLAENQIDFVTCDKYDPSMGSVSPFRCSLRDAIILASIIEKEVQTPEDMKHVAGILFNRLEIGMPLQVDSTLTFINQKTSATLTTDDLKMNSLYNTYTNRGLPPGPICNPGMNAILAVLHPTDSKDFYFLTTKDGRAIYAKTHDQHVANKQKYLK